MTRCAVVGGGILGMALALRMARNGWSVTLYEQHAELGGLAAPWRLGGIMWDRHPQIILRSDTALLQLLRELHLESDIVWRRARSKFFPALRPFDKRRFARPQRLGYVRGGYRTIIDALSRALAHEGVRIRTATTIECVQSARPHLSVETIEGPRFYDRVIMTMPAPAIARVASALSGEEHDRLRAIAYQGIVAASLLLDQPLGDTYITNVADAHIPFTSAIEMTALVDPETFGGRHLVYALRYCTPRDPFFVLGDADMRSQAIRALQRMHPSLKADTVRAFRVSREPAAFAIRTTGYSGGIPGFLTSCPGLYIATSAQIVNGTPSVNETLALAHEAATAIEADPRYARGGTHEAAR